MGTKNIIPLIDDSSVSLTDSWSSSKIQATIDAAILENVPDIDINDLDLSSYETKTDSENKLTESKTYTDNKLEESKTYTDNQFTEAQTDAQNKLTEAKTYADTVASQKCQVQIITWGDGD